MPINPERRFRARRIRRLERALETEQEAVWYNRTASSSRQWEEQLDVACAPRSEYSATTCRFRCRSSRDRRESNGIRSTREISRAIVGSSARTQCKGDHQPLRAVRAYIWERDRRRKVGCCRQRRCLRRITMPFHCLECDLERARSTRRCLSAQYHRGTRTPLQTARSRGADGALQRRRLFRSACDSARRSQKPSRDVSPASSAWSSRATHR